MGPFQKPRSGFGSGLVFWTFHIFRVAEVRLWTTIIVTTRAQLGLFATRNVAIIVAVSVLHWDAIIRRHLLSSFVIPITRTRHFFHFTADWAEFTPMAEIWHLTSGFINSTRTHHFSFGALNWTMCRAVSILLGNTIISSHLFAHLIKTSRTNHLTLSTHCRTERVRRSTEIFLWAPIIINSTRAKLILLRTESGTVTRTAI